MVHSHEKKIAMALQEKRDARLVLLIVLDGNKGNSITLVGDAGSPHEVSDVLINCAYELRQHEQPTQLQ